MERVFLFKGPEIPDDIIELIPTGFEVHNFDPDSGFSDYEFSVMPCFLCMWSYYKENSDAFEKLNVPDESLIIVYKPDEAEDIVSCRFVYQFVRSDRPDALKRSLRNLKKVILRNHDYLKAKNLNKELLSIGIALSAERNNDKLLNDILYKIRQITKADAGSLYLLEKIEDSDEQNMLFKIAHNDSNPSDFTEFRMSLNTESIAGYVAVTSNVLNIPDAYAIPDSEPYSFNNSYDIATDYRSRSILTVPMLDHHENIIGVIQLINRKKSFKKILENAEDVAEFVEPFDNEDENIVLSLASQAAVALENNILYNEIETLFEGFVAASVTAIESRDPTTSGHSSRVAAYTVEAAKAINTEQNGIFAGVTFSDDQLKELRYAGLLHDFGKVGVREAVLVKSKKLYPGHLELIKLRFAYIKKCIELEYADHKDRKRFEQELEEADTALEVITAADEPAINIEDPVSRLEEYNRKKYTDPDGNESPWITDEEYELLSIRKGSLTENERKEIESHVEHSTDFLENIPWTSTLKGLPDIARGHHERMNGTGYPDGKSGGELSLQSRIMAVADIYDALTASDRPYKRALDPEIAIKIILEEAANNHLDSAVVDIFIKKKIYETGVDK